MAAGNATEFHVCLQACVRPSQRGIARIAFWRGIGGLCRYVLRRRHGSAFIVGIQMQDSETNLQRVTKQEQFPVGFSATTARNVTYLNADQHDYGNLNA